MARAVVFDMDDTLIDWRDTQRHALDTVADEHLGDHRRDDVHAAYRDVEEENFASFRATGRWWYVGDRLRRLGEMLQSPADVDTMVGTFRTAVASRLALAPGAVAVLAVARQGRRTAILTNGPADVQRPKVERLGLAGQVDIVCIAGEMDLWKPDARAFEETLRRLGVPARDTMMVGDSLEFDIHPARGLGMSTAWIGGDDPAEADIVVPGIAALHGHLASLRS